jgi:hypothetical protein
MSLLSLRNKKRVGWFLQQQKTDKKTEVVLVDKKTNKKYKKWERKEKETEWDTLIKQNLLPDYLKNRDLYDNT